MRYNINKKNSTKEERIVYEILKKLKVEFKHRWMINGKEIDFVVKDYAIDINGHEQNDERNSVLLLSGYTPIHFHNEEVRRERDKVENKLRKILDNEFN